MSFKPDTVTPVVRCNCCLHIGKIFGQSIEMAITFSVFTNLIWTMTEILTPPPTQKKNSSQVKVSVKLIS